jgi:two-component system sensor histidine kinase TctE
VQGDSRDLDKKQPLAPAHKAQGAIVLGVEQIEKLRNATRRTSQLAHQLLALSRADARSMDAQPLQRVDLKDLCETLLENFLDAATGKGLDLGLEVQPVRHRPWLAAARVDVQPGGQRHQVHPGGWGGHAAGGVLVPSGALRVYLEVEDDGPACPR